MLILIYRMVQRIGPNSFQWFPATEQGETDTNCNIESSSVREKKTYYFEGDKALEKLPKEVVEKEENVSRGV